MLKIFNASGNLYVLLELKHFVLFHDLYDLLITMYISDHIKIDGILVLC